MSEISVIIPVYNRVNLIGDTLHSVLNQTQPADEIIIVDDHSTDGTYNVIKKQFAGRVMLVRNQGRGPGAARNLGFKISTGRFIKYFDSDDVMTRNSLEDQYTILRNSCNGLVYGPYFYARKKENWVPEDDIILNYYPFKNNHTFAEWMLKGLFITIPGMMMERALLEQAGEWRTDVFAYEDWDYLFRLALLEPYPAHTNNSCFVYRLHGDQIVGEQFSNRTRDADKIKVMTYLDMVFLCTNRSFTWWAKGFFRARLYQLYSIYGNDFPQLMKYNKLSLKVFWQLYRIHQKWGRIRTGIPWQPYHGPVKDRKKIQDYLNLLDR